MASTTSLFGSFAVNIARNVWSCRSMSCMQAHGGRPAANILDLVALMEGCSIRDAALRLQDWSGAAPQRFIVSRTSRPDPVRLENSPLRFVLQYVDATYPYLTSRGVTPQSVRMFGLGLDSGKGLLRGRIVIPIHNAAGELVAYAGRAVDGEEPKYRFPAGSRKLLVLFNLHRAIATKARAVVVVEGFFDTIAVHQPGYPVDGVDPVTPSSGSLGTLLRSSGADADPKLDKQGNVNPAATSARDRNARF
jgi:hypothetical protein